MSDPASAEAMYRPPAFELLTTASNVFNLPQPAPVLWRDPDPRTDPGDVDAVLSVGELAEPPGSSSWCGTRTTRPRSTGPSTG